MKAAWIVVLVCAVCAGAAAQGPTTRVGAGEELIEVRVPRPQTIRTPQDVPATVERIAKPPVFVAPRGTVNLALKRPVSSSDSEPIIGELAMVTDGDKEGTEGSYIEIGPGKQWVQIDLGASCDIRAVVVWHSFASSSCVCKSVAVQVSDDVDCVKGVTTIFNNDREDALGLGIGKDRQYIESHLGKLIEARGVRGRYVRLWSRGSTEMDTNRYVEVEVYGVKR